ncbi:MAG: translation initiation factor [Nitrospiraceae bacterium]|nr:translation initiation factor [Nitrospiraceae bacterium]
MNNNNSKLVYSTEKSVQRRDASEKAINKPALPFDQQRVIVKLDRKARAGKAVTIVEGIKLPQKDMEALLKRLKTRLATGGTIKEGSFEIQGDHCSAVLDLLKRDGFNPKRSGG